MRSTIREPKLYVPPAGDGGPPRWVRWLLVATCGGVSFAHGSNDGQKGMGLILLVLIGFLPAHYALDTNHPADAAGVHAALAELRAATGGPDNMPDERMRTDFLYLEQQLDAMKTLEEVPAEERWNVRQAIFRLERAMKADPKLREHTAARKHLRDAIEFVPVWVVVGVALALGIGTMIGYKRIVVTVAEKIGKQHLTYAQGAAAELVAAASILAADLVHAPVSTTQVLSSAVAGTMAANRSGLQAATGRRILLAWLLTLPSTIVLSGVFFTIGRWLTLL
jgi:phosphate/sulfate permease